MMSREVRDINDNNNNKDLDKMIDSDNSKNGNIEKLEQKKPLDRNIEHAAFQILENSNLAIKQFITDLNDNIPTENQGYFLLHYYGFLQALINQQDTITYLYRVKKGKNLSLPDNLRFIRKIKEQSIGHLPGYTSKGSGRYCYITDTYLTPDNKMYYIILNDKENCDDMVCFDPVELAEHNRKFLCKVLKEIELDNFVETLSDDYKNIC